MEKYLKAALYREESIFKSWKRGLWKIIILQASVAEMMKNKRKGD